MDGGRAADGIDFLDPVHALERDDSVLRHRAITIADTGEPTGTHQRAKVIEQFGHAFLQPARSPPGSCAGQCQVRLRRCCSRNSELIDRSKWQAIAAAAPTGSRAQTRSTTASCASMMR